MQTATYSETIIHRVQGISSPLASTIDYLSFQLAVLLLCVQRIQIFLHQVALVPNHWGWCTADPRCKVLLSQAPIIHPKQSYLASATEADLLPSVRSHLRSGIGLTCLVTGAYAARALADELGA